MFVQAVEDRQGNDDLLRGGIALPWVTLTTNLERC